jgi:hypothetical protein
MASKNGEGVATRRDFLRRAVPVGAICAGCPGVMKSELLAQVVGRDQEAHKFLKDAGLTTEQVFQLAYTNTLLPFLRGLGEGRDHEGYLEELRGIASDHARALIRDFAEQVPDNDLATFTAPYRDPESRAAQALTMEIVEYSEDVCEYRVTECLWAKTFRDADAADLGEACICHPDYAAIEAFNPDYEMVRDKTLMAGDECCNHRYQRKGRT